MRVVKNGGKNAITHYQIIKTILNSFSLIECRLETGRTHQIRVHLNHLGYPLVGEKTYNNNLRFFNHQLALDTKELIKTFPRQALHSYKIGFIHPTTYKELDFSIELASDITELITMLESYESFI
jgi:23S rRNA pseudouridine1911/1915/1917 synthase